MVSIAATIAGGALVNALAFSGSNYFFSKIGKSDDSEIERERHDKAMEQLEEAKTKFSEDRTKRMDFLIEQMRKEQHSTEEFRESHEAMREYYELKNEKEPVLSDFYVPSEDQKDRELLFVTIGMSLVLFLGWKLW